jgi:hypothetical protein
MGGRVEMGNSVQMVKRHYQRPVPPKLVDGWFAIQPAKTKVVPIRATGRWRIADRSFHRRDRPRLREELFPQTKFLQGLTSRDSTSVPKPDAVDGGPRSSRRFQRSQGCFWRAHSP